MIPAQPCPDAPHGFRRKPCALRGFALVATLMMLILLVVIAVGLLSLSSVSLRTSGHGSATAEARANARLGLMIAIGQLQQLSGQDQRVTATANIIDNAANGKRHWTGVWSTEKWDVTQPNQREFIGWLVSDSQLDPANPLTTESVKQPATSEGLVTLVGNGSTQATPGNEVKARLVTVKQATGGASGAYAYWVGDQGVKASYGIAGHGAQDDWNDAAQLAIMKRVGIESAKIPALDTYANLTGDRLRIGATSFLTMDTAHGAGTARQVFHDFAPRSLSLLTDTRLAGFARDLSTAFELPNAEFHNIGEFHGTNEKNTTNAYGDFGSAYADAKFYGNGESSRLGYLAEIRNGSAIFRGPTWDLLRNHYRLYKRDWDASGSWSRAYPPVGNRSFASRGILPHSYSIKYDGPGASLPFFTYHPGTARFYARANRGGWAGINYLDKPRNGFDVSGANAMIHARSPRLMPIVSRITIGFSLLQMPVPNAADWNLAIAFDPYITLVNPYNVPISFQSIGLFTAKINPFGGKIRFTDRATDQPREAPLGDYFSANVYNQGSFAFRIPPPAGQAAWVLEPGEVKVISPVKTGRQDIGRAKINRVRGQFEYSEDAGLYYYYTQNNKWQVKPKDGTVVHVEIDGNDGNEQDMFTVHLHYAKDHAGGSRDVMAHIPPTNMFAENDGLDDPHVAIIGYARGNNGPEGRIQIRRSLNTSQIPTEASGPQTIAAIDIRMKSARGDTPLFWLNPRGQAFDTRDYDGGQRTSPLWDSRVIPIGDFSELQLVANPAGNGFWGDNHTAMNGTTRVVLYEVPQIPLTSPAQLQHADFSLTGSGGSLMLGNSFAHLGIADLKSIVARRNRVSNAHTSINPQTLGDMAWAGNEMLWDRYFFSGMNWGDATLPLTGAKQANSTHDAAVDALLAADYSAEYPLMNPRMILFDPAHSAKRRDEIKDYTKIAAHLAVEGGFNVNSTSERAWRAMFSTLRAATITYAENGSVSTQAVDNAFSRFTIPSAKATSLWEGGFHNLSDQQIEDLAKAMVEQVRERGPFMGLADFVNRRLDSAKGSAGTDVGVLGALQAAIEKAGLNDRPEVSNPTTATYIEHKKYQVGGETKSFSTYVGTPGYVMQADILSALGSNLRARSDTFLIRAYGESRDASGKVLAQAWCEATVQRTPQWTTPTDIEPTITDPSYSGSNPAGDLVVRPWLANPDFPAVNKNFGRAYKMVGFRWLNASEI